MGTNYYLYLATKTRGLVVSAVMCSCPNKPAGGLIMLSQQNTLNQCPFIYRITKCSPVKLVFLRVAVKYVSGILQNPRPLTAFSIVHNKHFFVGDRLS